MPKRVKHRKVMRGRMSGMAKGGTAIAFGEYGLMTQEPAWITSRQIEAARRAMTRYVKRGGKIWIRIFPDKPVTKKPAEVRMGSGKGAPDHWVAVVKPGPHPVRDVRRAASTRRPRRCAWPATSCPSTSSSSSRKGWPPMDIDKVRALNDVELVNELATARRHLYDLRFQLATRQLTDYTQISQTRRTVARYLTVLTERHLDQAGRSTEAAGAAR